VKELFNKPLNYINIGKVAKYCDVLRKNRALQSESDVYSTIYLVGTVSILLHFEYHTYMVGLLHFCTFYIVWYSNKLGNIRRM
jgi:hypothetical protein